MIGFFAIAALIGTGCVQDTGSDQSGTTAVYASIDGAILTKSWPARMASDSERARFEGKPGWRAVFENDLSAALDAFDAKIEPRGVARVHQGLSDLYHQAALLYSNAAVEAYESDAQPSDPTDMAYIVAVGHVVRGDIEKAKLRFGGVDKKGSFGQRSQAWMALLNEGAKEPTLSQLESISGSLGAVLPGTEPPVQVGYDAQLVEQTERAKSIKVKDPTRLLARSAWHAAAASMVIPQDDAGVLAQVSARYAVDEPTEASPVTLKLDDAWLFASADLVADDMAFVAQAKIQGVAAVTAWAEKSALAAAIQPAITEGRVDPQKVLDAGLALQKQLQAMMKDIGGGEMAFHRPFAQRARISVLMAGMVVADANDQYRDAGILRLNALERMEQTGIDPVFAIAVSAWDAGNRNPMRPEELLHQFKSSYPALNAARGPLEALHLRLSRNAGPANPVH